MKSNQKGFGAVEVVLVLVLVGLLVFVGWRFISNQNGTDTPETVNTNQTTPNQNEDEVPEVQSESDLKKAEDYLNETNIDQQLDTSEIDSALSE